MAGMETRMGFFHGEDIDIMRQCVVEAHEQLLGGEADRSGVGAAPLEAAVSRAGWSCAQCEVCDLAAGVDAGIGAAGAVKFEVAGAEHLFGCFEQFALYGAIVFLYLPAGIAAAVVFEGDFVAQLSEE